MLGIAAITYLPLLIYVVPEVHNQENERTALINNREGEYSIKKLVYAGVMMLANTTNFDLVYTAIERAVSINCNTHVWIGAWVYWVFYSVFFLLVSLYQVRIYEKAEITSALPFKECMRNCTQTFIWGIVYAFLLSVFAGLYILADTRLPLACTGVAKNDARTRHGIRIGLWVITLFVAAGVIIIWTCWQNKHHKRYALY